jgi:hypothetical protein
MCGNRELWPDHSTDSANGLEQNMFHSSVHRARTKIHPKKINPYFGVKWEEVWKNAEKTR